MELGPKAIRQFKKYHPFKARMAYTHPFQLADICRLNVDISNSDEIETTANWLCFLGSALKTVRISEEIKNQSMKNRFLQMIKE